MNNNHINRIISIFILIFLSFHSSYGMSLKKIKSNSKLYFQSEKTIAYNNIIYTKITSGADKNVYISRDKKTVLLKYKDTSKSAFFRKEVNILTKLNVSENHPNIINMLQYDEKNLIIILEAIPINLLDYLNTRKNISIKEKLKILLDIANGISYMHSSNIIHNDIKPENVVISKELTAKLIDFSFSEESIFGTDYSNPKVLNGTVEYISPNVLKTFFYKKTDANRKKRSFKDDVYAFAILTYNVMHYKDIRREFNLELDRKKISILKNKQEANKQFIKYLLKKDWRPPLYKDEDMNGILNNLISRCWARNASDRPYIDEVREELKLILKNL